ncbi:hypothetical protein ACSBR2_029360 [Camellia fascicularis]
MYKKIYRADFKFRPWFSPETQMIVNRLLDTNPITRILASELMDATWFKFNNTIPKNVKRMRSSGRGSRLITAMSLWESPRTRNNEVNVALIVFESFCLALIGCKESLVNRS